MIEESFFFVRIRELGRRPVVTCAPDQELVEVAQLMGRLNISGVVVTEGGHPIGIITDRDFRSLIARVKGELAGHRARDVMRGPLVTIAEDGYVFEAIYKMAKHNIHRLVVLDTAGNLVSIITDTDLLALQTRTPLYL